jgi:RNA polymerase sigma-54 factor
VYIQPDLSIQGGLVQLLALPTLTVDPQYRALLDTTQDPVLRRYLQEKLQALEQVIEDLGRRNATIARCGEVIARTQGDFFAGGPLEKLTLRDVAQELEVHESTVSRAVKGKYVQCSRGILPMRSFFSRSAGQNPALCRERIQAVLAALVSQEDPRRPLSDQALAQLLEDRHIHLSRRAVAKYRGELGIRPAHLRRQVG